MAHNLTGYKPSDYFGYFFPCLPSLSTSVYFSFCYELFILSPLACRLNVIDPVVNTFASNLDKLNRKWRVRWQTNLNQQYELLLLLFQIKTVHVHAIQCCSFTAHFLVYGYILLWSKTYFLGNAINNAEQTAFWGANFKLTELMLLYKHVINFHICLFRQYQGLDELLTRSCDNTNPLITQLDTIDRVARLWLEMASHLNLNIFKGFKDEESLVNYALNINNSKRGDTSKLVAGLFYLVIIVSLHVMVLQGGWI